jgi:hypothetical protein
MEKTITIKGEYNSLDLLNDFLKKENTFESSKEYDSWNVRTDVNGQMEQCLIIKKSAMHGMKVYFQKDNTLKMDYIIPNKVMNAYFGKSVKARRNIIEIVTGVITQAVLKGPQQKAFEEMEQVFNKISA